MKCSKKIVLRGEGIGKPKEYYTCGHERPW